MTNFAVLRIFLFGLLLSCIVQKTWSQGSIQQPQDSILQTQNDLKSELSNVMTEAVRGVIGSGNLTVSQVDHFMDSDTGATISGTANFLGAQGVGFTARFNAGDTLLSFQASPAAGQSPGGVQQQLGQLMPLNSLYLPQEVQGALALKQFNLDFGQGGATQIRTVFQGSGGWQPFPSLDFLANGFTVSFTLDDSLGQKQLSGSLNATCAWNGKPVLLHAPLTANPQNWALTGTMRNFSLQDIFAIDESFSFPLDGFFQEIIMMNIDSFILTCVPFNQEIRGNAGTKLGGLMFVFNKDNRAGHVLTEGEDPPTYWDIVAGFNFITMGSFANAMPGLGVLDVFQPQQAGIFLSNTVTQLPDDMTNFFGNRFGGGILIRQGLTVIARYDLSADSTLKQALKCFGPPINSLPVNHFLLWGNLPGDPSNLTLEAVLDFSKSVNIQDVLFFKNLRLQAQPLNGEPNFSLLCDMDLRLDSKNTLKLRGGLNIFPTSFTAVMQAALLNDWVEPFGFPNLTVGNLGITAGLNFSSATPTPDNMMLYGKMTLGTFTGDATIGFDRTQLNRNMLYVSFNELGMMDVINGFCSPQIVGQIPGYVQPYLDATLRDVTVKLVPPPENFVRLDGATFTPGLTVAGRGSLANWKGNFLFDLEGSLSGLQAGMTVHADMDPILWNLNNQQPILHITNSQYDTSAGPELMVNLSTTQLLTLNIRDTLVYGNAAINVLGAESGNVYMLVTPSGISSQLYGKLYGILDAGIQLQFQASDFGNSYISANANLDTLASALAPYMSQTQNALYQEMGAKSFTFTGATLNGYLRDLQSGGTLTVRYKIAGANDSVSVALSFGDPGAFYTALANTILNEVAGDLDAAKNWANGNLEGLKNAWNNQLDLQHISKITEKFKDSRSFWEWMWNTNKASQEKIKIPGPQFRIIAQNGLILAQDDSHDIRLTEGGTIHDTLLALWQFIPADTAYHPGYFYIVSSADGRNFNESGNNKVEGKSIKLRQHREEHDDTMVASGLGPIPSNEHIKLMPVKNNPGYYYFQLEKSGMYVGTENSRTAAGTSLVQTALKGPSTMFRIEAAGWRDW